MQSHLYNGGFVVILSSEPIDVNKKKTDNFQPTPGGTPRRMAATPGGRRPNEKIRHSHNVTSRCVSHGCNSSGYGAPSPRPYY